MLIPPVTTPVELIEVLIGYLQDKVEDCRIVVGEGRRARRNVSSGYAENPVMAHHAACGFCGVESKPYTSEKLLAVVRQVLMGNDNAPACIRQGR